MMHRPKGYKPPLLLLDQLDRERREKEVERRLRELEQQNSLTPQERFAARVEKLRASGVKNAVEIASPEFHIGPRQGYRWLAQLEQEHEKQKH
jgi:hypothetical protein